VLSLDVDTGNVHGVFVRHIPDGDPLYEPSEPADGRWQHGTTDLDRVALLDNDRRLTRVGLPPPSPTQQKWPACQHIGDALHEG